MSSLYELKNEFLALKEMLEDETIDDEIVNNTIEGIEYEIEIKAENYAKIIKELEGQADAIRKEIMRLDEKHNKISNNIDKLKNNLKLAMIETGKTKIKTDLFSFNVCKNGGKIPIIINDVEPDEIPEKYIEKVEIVKMNRDAIREDLEKGINLEFARFGERGESLRIK